MSLVNDSVDTNLSVEETIAIGGFTFNGGTGKDRIQNSDITIKVGKDWSEFQQSNNS